MNTAIQIRMGISNHAIRAMLGLIVTAASSAVVQADILPVPGEFDSIQACIDAAEKGDECVVDSGTYSECIDLMGKEITVRSLSGPLDTMIDGTGADCTVVRMAAGETRASQLLGFTIVGGNPIGPFPGNLGGGIYIEDSDPTVEGCIVIDNVAGNGGGIYVNAGDPLISRCSFIANVATGLGVPGGFGGGGAFVNDGNPEFVSCFFALNDMPINNAGGMYIFGDSAPTISNCTFVDNTAHDRGGGLHIYTTAIPTIVNSVFWGNSDVGGDDESAQIHIQLGNVLVSYCDVQGLIAGGALDNGTNIGLDPQLTNLAGPDGILGTTDDNGILQPTSPGVDAGDNTVVASEFDITGGPRIAASAVDMGAYELQPDDTDGDGVPDDVDDCPTSDLAGAIVIDGCDTTVANVLFEDGCTMSDLILECAEQAYNYGNFVSCVSELANGWKQDGPLRGREKGRIQSCAAQSNIGHACSGDADCDDLVFCNGVEVCLEGECISGDPCPGQECDEEDDSCID